MQKSVEPDVVVEDRGGGHEVRSGGHVDVDVDTDNSLIQCDDEPPPNHPGEPASPWNPMDISVVDDKPGDDLRELFAVLQPDESRDL